MVIWIMGLAGSGKTTLAKLIIKKIKKDIIHIDGDAIRNIYDERLTHSVKDREINAKRISKLVKYLSDQKKDLVVSVLSNFPKWLKWNKKNLKRYFLIYIKTEKSILLKRKPELYDKKTKNVVGVDIKFNEPLKPDYIIDNCLTLEKLSKEPNLILRKVKNF